MQSIVVVVVVVVAVVIYSSASLSQSITPTFIGHRAMEMHFLL